MYVVMYECLPLPRLLTLLPVDQSLFSSLALELFFMFFPPCSRHLVLFQKTRNWPLAWKIGSRVASLRCQKEPTTYVRSGVTMTKQNLQHRRLKKSKNNEMQNMDVRNSVPSSKKNCRLALLLGEDTKQTGGSYAHGEQCIAFTSENNLPCFFLN